MTRIEGTQLVELSGYLRQMNDLLEKILHAQFGIEDKRWLDAIQTIEEGFMGAVDFVAEAKGKKRSHVILMKDDIDEVLRD